MPAKKKFTRALFDRILSRFDAGQKTVPAIESEGISVATFYRHLDQDPELRTLYSAARDARDIPALESEAYRRAVEGNLKPVYQGGQKVGEIREFSDSLLMFLLKARKPGTYARPELTVTQNVLQPQIQAAKLSAKDVVNRWRAEMGQPPIVDMEEA